ncbi:phosphatase domain-containing protein [Hymenobacter sp.]|uniref:App1 family protein n=1 Tax=Hymenobacter sp. TaxID=1898978 RepID=UPI00286A7E0D|nr:phosphatase domain-containing protein [Hymenobacter sp.]
MTNKILAWLRLTRRPVLKLYRGFGSPTCVVVQGHAFRQSPLPRTRYRARFWTNAWGLLRLFAVRPWADAPVRVRLAGRTVGARTDADGFFRVEITPPAPLPPGWHPAAAELLDPATGAALARGTAEAHVPYETPYAFISDIDDTFLVSHSATRYQRLWVLLSRNARSRAAFADVAAHYQWLAQAGAPAPGPPNAFFYVSSSEWNLYDFILEFAEHQRLPKGVYQLSQLKRLRQLLRTGQNKHATKLDRIVRVLEACPSQYFGLLGDDSQQDPGIYAAVVKRFPGRIKAVYVRQVHALGRPAAAGALAEIAAAGVATCYFEHSRDALLHSQGLAW